MNKKRSSKYIRSISRSGINGEENDKLFGTPLENLVDDEVKIPTILENLIETIEPFGLDEEGIYLISTNKNRINDLKKKLNDFDEDVDFKSYDSFILTDILKVFFRELPEPLMTFHLYQDFLSTNDIQDSKTKIRTLFKCINKLPKPNYDVLEYILFHLGRVAQKSIINRMNAQNLATVFGPILLKSKKMKEIEKLFQNLTSVNCQNDLKQLMVNGKNLIETQNDTKKQIDILRYMIEERVKQIKNYNLADLSDFNNLENACYISNRSKSL